MQWGFVFFAVHSLLCCFSAYSQFCFSIFSFRFFVSVLSAESYIFWIILSRARESNMYFCDSLFLFLKISMDCVWQWWPLEHSCRLTSETPAQVTKISGKKNGWKLPLLLMASFILSTTNNVWDMHIFNRLSYFRSTLAGGIKVSIIVWQLSDKQITVNVTLCVFDDKGVETKWKKLHYFSICDAKEFVSSHFAQLVSRFSGNVFAVVSSYPTVSESLCHMNLVSLCIAWKALVIKQSW